MILKAWGVVAPLFLLLWGKCLHVFNPLIKYFYLGVNFREDKRKLWVAQFH